MVFANGDLVLSGTTSEQEQSTILKGLRTFYTIHDWNDVDNLLMKIGKTGHRVKDLRKLHTFSPRDTESADIQNEILRSIFGIKQ